MAEAANVEAATASATSSSAGRCREALTTGSSAGRRSVCRRAVGILIAVLMLAPLDKKGDVSFILDKKKVENAPERMRVEAARYTGTDNKGQLFVMTANRAIQRSSDVPLVDINGMFARLALAQGPLLIAANQGRYNIDSQKVAIDGPVKVAGPDGYRLATRDVTVDLKQRQLASAGPVAGPDASWPVPGGAAQGRSWRAYRGPRWRRSLENRPRGGQMMAVRSIGIILATLLVGGDVDVERRDRPAAAAAGFGAQGPQQQRAGGRHRRSNRGPGSRRPRDLRRQRSRHPGRADARHGAADGCLFGRAIAAWRRADPAARRGRRSGRPQPVGNRARATSESTISTAS